MNALYYANFVSGLQDLIADALKCDVKDLLIKKTLDGAFVFETACPHEKLKHKYFNNLFAILNLREAANQHPLEAHIQEVCRRPFKVAPLSGKAPRTFRIITSYANQLTAIGENTRRSAEYHIARQTGLRLSRSKSDVEFWFLYRTEGFSLFMQRLSYHTSFDKVLHKGELTPPLAYALCAAAHLPKDALVLDPFCGYGAIPKACLTYFPVRTCYAFDISDAALSYTRRAMIGIAAKRAIIRKLDVYALPSLIPAGSLDAIITDPPWGLYERLLLPLPRFYADMLELFAVILKLDGSITLLTAQTELVKSIVEESNTFIIEKTISVLVSGRKASIFRLKKRSY
ncbi:MAG: methyltransferase [Treponema sp.]|jgi:predicted RNA methylase|nr:methyltransferase [Treponema sp.]